MFKLKKVVTLLIILFVLLGIMSINVKATGNTIINLNNYISPTSNTVDEEPENETTENVTLNTTTGGSVVQPQTNSSSESENNLPQTGVTEDITIMFFIVVCIVSAVYAYKKIRDYRN